MLAADPVTAILNNVRFFEVIHEKMKLNNHLWFGEDVPPAAHRIRASMRQLIRSAAERFVQVGYAEISSGGLFVQIDQANIGGWIIEVSYSPLLVNMISSFEEEPLLTEY